MGPCKRSMLGTFSSVTASDLRPWRRPRLVWLNVTFAANWQLTVFFPSCGWKLIVFINGNLAHFSSLCLLGGWRGLSRGGQDLSPAFLRSDWLIGRRKWGHGSLPFPPFFLVLSKRTPDYCSGSVLLFMHAADLHCPSCPTNWGMRTCHRRPEAAGEKKPHFHLYSWQPFDLNERTGCRVDLHDKACFIPSHCQPPYVETVLFDCHVFLNSQRARWLKKIQVLIFSIELSSIWGRLSSPDCLCRVWILVWKESGAVHRCCLERR